MYNFELKNPVKIIFGKDTISRVVDEIPKNARVLMTYGGGSIKQNGVYEQVKNALKDVGLMEFGGIEPNPHYETCMKAVEFVKAENIDFLLSVGGGSVLDATKFIAAAACLEKSDAWDILTRKIKVENAVPLGAVLTLPATGSEMNGSSVITRVSSQEKMAFNSPLVLPQFSILDPQCVYTLPDKQIANGIVDAFIHTIEQYLTFPVNSPIQDRFAESILTTLIEEGPKVLANKKDYDAAANFMWSATVALNGWISPGVPQDWATHMIGHELTAFHGIDHARTLAIVLPGVMNIKRENKKEKIIQYGKRIWGITEGSDDEKIDAAIVKTIEFFKSLGLPTTLPDYNVGEETIAKIVARFEKRPYKLGEKADIDFRQVEEILKDRL
jgi:NADP-dependent alcohol dehydrogenase